MNKQLSDWLVFVVNCLPSRNATVRGKHGTSKFISQVLTPPVSGNDTVPDTILTNIHDVWKPTVHKQIPSPPYPPDSPSNFVIPCPNVASRARVCASPASRLTNPNWAILLHSSCSGKQKTRRPCEKKTNCSLDAASNCPSPRHNFKQPTAPLPIRPSPKTRVLLSAEVHHMTQRPAM